MKSLILKLFKRADWEFHKFKDAFYRRVTRPPYVMTYRECVDYVLKNKASICRFGDGELAVIHGRMLGFQQQNPRLAARLKEVLTTDITGLLTCIPDTFSNLTRYNQVEQNFWKSHHYYNRARWMRLLDCHKKYGNTFLSRFYSMEFNKELSAQRLDILKKLWQSRDIIFVEGADTKLGCGNDLFNNAKSIRRVICPSTDAFSCYDRILSAVQSLEADDNTLFILALGPTATVLAADMHTSGLQSFDLGHIDIEYEWFCKGATSKIPVTGKFSNEAAILGLADSPVTGQLISSDYESQIILNLTK